MSNYQEALYFARSFDHDEYLITQLGKFEGESLYIPYFYYFSANGDGDWYTTDTGHDGVQFQIDNMDIENFPELADYDYVSIFETNDGFIYGHAHNDDRQQKGEKTMTQNYEFDTITSNENERIIVVFNPEINGECWEIKQKYSTGTYVKYADRDGIEHDAVIEEFDRTFYPTEADKIKAMCGEDLIDYCLNSDNIS